MAWRDALLLVVTARVARELEHLGRHVLDDGGEVDRATGAVALGEAHVAQVLADARHREGEASLGRLGDRLLALATASSCSLSENHFCVERKKARVG